MKFLLYFYKFSLIFWFSFIDHLEYIIFLNQLFLSTNNSNQFIIIYHFKLVIINFLIVFFYFLFIFYYLFIFYLFKFFLLNFETIFVF